MRSNVRMQESYRQTKQDLPYFNTEQDNSIVGARYANRRRQETNLSTEYYPRYQNFKTQFSQLAAIDTGYKRNYVDRNQIMKELRQQYEILKNLNIEDSIHIHVRKYEKEENRDDGSEVSSSVQSKKASKVTKKQKNQISRFDLKEMENLNLEKKQLQMVIGNSMRKIEELLTNQISLKKTIHEMKNQIEGKGGISSEFEKTIRNYKKNEEQLQEQLDRVTRENEKNLHKSKELSEKIRHLENELQLKERQIKSHFEEQRKFHQLIRIEKDKYLNMEIQCKSFKMEYQLLEKQKTNQINRLIRQFESKQGGNQKQMSYMIKRLEDQLAHKDKKYIELATGIETYKKDYQLLRKEHDLVKRESQIHIQTQEKKQQKNYVEQFMYKSREVNENNNKAMAESMNLIFNRMTEIQKKNQQSLKKQIQALRRKNMQDSKIKANTITNTNTNNNDIELFGKISQLQRIIQKEIAEKERYLQEIQKLKTNKYELQEKNAVLEKDIRQFTMRQEQLRDEIVSLQNAKNSYNSNANQTLNQYKNTKIELSESLNLVKTYESQKDQQKYQIQSLRTEISKIKDIFKDKERRYEQQLNKYRNNLNTTSFQTEKARKQGQFNLNLYKVEREAQVRRLREDIARLTTELRNSEASNQRLEGELEKIRVSKAAEIQTLKYELQNFKKKYDQDMDQKRVYYEQKYSNMQNNYSTEIKTFNEKFMTISTSNENMMSQIAYYSKLEKQLVELRRALRTNKTLGDNVDHLWLVKEAQYSNINQLLSGYYQY